MRLEIVIKSAYQKLKKNNIKSALLDSELLLSSAINKSREFVILNSNHNVSKKENHSFQAMINQRSMGKPIAYIIGKKFFWKYDFYISEKVLIPRPDTEVIVEEVLKLYKKKKKYKFFRYWIWFRLYFTFNS